MKFVIEYDMSGDMELGQIVDCIEKTLAALKEHTDPTWTYAQMRGRSDPSQKFTAVCEITRPGVTLANGMVFGRVVLTDAPLDKTAYSLTQRDCNGAHTGVVDTTTGQTIRA